MTASPRIVAIVGATATGKTEIGEALAPRLNGEIVCADSRQVFAELDIGTGKPDPAERRARPHHLFDAMNLGRQPSAGWFARAASAVCGEIHRRGGVPIVVGGSGLYLRSLQQGLSGAPPRDAEIRASLAAELAAWGPEALHRRLAASDPETAARLAPSDVQRVSRALEVFEASGQPLSFWHRTPPLPPLRAEWRVFEITASPETQAERIPRRTRAMFEGGLVEEVRQLIGRGLEPSLRALAAVGYDEALELVAGHLTRAQAEERTNQRTRQLAKRQRTWFRHQVSAVRLPGDEGAGKVVERIRDELLRDSPAKG